MGATNVFVLATIVLDSTYDKMLGKNDVVDTVNYDTIAIRIFNFSAFQ